MYGATHGILMEIYLGIYPSGELSYQTVCIHHGFSQWIIELNGPNGFHNNVPSGKHTKNDGKSPL